MSTPGPERTPSTVKVDKTSGQGKPPAGGTRPAGAGKGRPAGKGSAGKGGKGGKGKKVTPVKVSGGANWAPFAVGGVVVLLAIGIIGYGVWASMKSGGSWEDRAAAIEGITNYRAQKNAKIDSRNHVDGALTYVTSPPVGGDHNATWQNCMGDVYTEPIANEHAVHSLEHGAVWVTYKQGLAQDQIDKLKARVEGKDYMLMSPVAGLDKNISLQVWGYQLKLDNADDARIDEFIKTLRLNASMEPGAVCSSGNTTTGPITTAATTDGASMGTN